MRDSAQVAASESPEQRKAGPARADRQNRADGWRRVVEWFWLGGAMRSLSANQSSLSARARELLRRARLAAELGGRALEPTHPFAHGTAEALACELYREALYWALAAYVELGRTRAGAADAVTNLDALWLQVDPELLERHTGGAERKRRLEQRVVRQSYVDFAELSPEDQASLARDLQSFVSALLADLDATQSALDRLWMRRILRSGSLLAAIVLAVVGAGFAQERLESRRDLAPASSWRASSRSPHGGCDSPQQSCPSGLQYFFHTEEDAAPWVEFDLGAAKRVSKVLVTNRLDCCQDRAVPLLVEVSSDRKSWRTVARRTEEFTTWRAKFAPTEARFVRLRLAKRASLHLSQVRILP